MLPTAPIPNGPQMGQETPQTGRYSYLPVLAGDGEPAYEVIDPHGRGTGIIRDTKLSANGVAQSLNKDARRAVAQRARRLKRARTEVS